MKPGKLRSMFFLFNLAFLNCGGLPLLGIFGSWRAKAGSTFLAKQVPEYEAEQLTNGNFQL